MQPRNPNLDWMRKVLADLESSRSDPRIAELMVGLTQPSPSIAADVEANSESVVGMSVPALRRAKR
jgi:hypothetical protein